MKGFDTFETKHIKINENTYCSYCGKVLRDGSFLSSRWASVICECEKAKKERSLKFELDSLLRTPLAENLVELELERYKNELLGKTVHIISV